MTTRPLHLAALLVASILMTQPTVADAARPGRTPSVRPAGGTATTVTTATASPLEPIGAQRVTIDVQVSPWGGVGDVTIWVDDKADGTVKMDIDGSGSGVVSLDLGQHTIVVKYSGYLDWLPSQSAPIAITQSAYGASRVTSLVPEGPLRALRLVELRATTPLPLAEIDGSVGVNGRRGPDLAGVTQGTLVQPDHKLYPGDWEVIAYVRDRLDRNLDMASCPVDFTVTKHAVTPTLTSPDLTIDWSMPIVLDYVGGPASVMPTEAEVEFRDGTGTLLGRSVLIDGKRHVTFDPTDFGTIEVSAQIGPDEFMQGPVRKLTFTVVPGVAPRKPVAKPRAKPTRISMIVDPAATQWDSGAPVLVDVDPATSGRVVLYSGARTIGETTVNSAGKGTIRLRTLPPGAHPLVAIYRGTKRFAPSRTAKRMLTVVQTPTTTAVTVDDATITWGDPVTATATVTPNPGGGVVSIDGNRVTLDPATGTAEVEIDGLGPGVRTIDARYEGRSPFGPSSATTEVTVGSLASSVGFNVAVGNVPDGPFARAGVSVHPLLEPEHLGEERNGRYDVFVGGRRIASRWDGGSTSFGLKLSPGTYDVQVKYRGNGILDPSVSAVQTIQVGARSSAPNNRQAPRSWSDRTRQQLRS